MSQEDLKSAVAKMEQSSQETEGFIEAFKKIFSEFFEESSGRRLDSQQFFAELWNSYGDKGLAELYIDWSLSAYLALQIEEALKRFHETHSICTKQNYIEEPFDFNDLDNKVFAIPVQPNEHELYPVRKVISVTTQNYNLLFVWQTNSIGQKFHVRRYWDKWIAEDKWDKEEEQQYKDKGINHAIAKAEWIVENYADDVPGNQYVRRPSLEWFAANGFQVDDVKRHQYGDARDDGYVLSWESGVGRGEHGKVDTVIHHWYLAKESFRDLWCALECLKED
jgi:hypothetical protein